MVHRQRVRLIRRQQSDDRRSQGLRLAKWSSEERVKCNSIPTRLSARNTMYTLVRVNTNVYLPLSFQLRLLAQAVG